MVLLLVGGIFLVLSTLLANLYYLNYLLPPISCFVFAIKMCLLFNETVGRISVFLLTLLAKCFLFCTTLLTNWVVVCSLYILLTKTKTKTKKEGQTFLFC